MQSKASTVAQYLADLPADRREVVEALRKVILKNLDKTYQEGMQYGMIGYYVPHSVFPDGYHCDPKQPLPYASLAAQKNFYSLYMMSLYGSSDLLKWFTSAWTKSGKKLDMGKCCIRFKKIDDLALDVIAEMFRRTPAKVHIAHYQAALGDRGSQKKPVTKASSKKTSKKTSKKSSTKKVAKKAAKQSTAKKRSR